MRQRITEKQLEALCDEINRLTGNPLKPWEKVGSEYRANVGNYHLSYAYGGVELQRMMNEHGGVNTPLGMGHGPKRELYEKMHAFIAGLQDKAA